MEQLLKGGDIRSLGNSHLLVDQIKTAKDFDALFPYLFNADRVVVLRAADVIEKVTAQHPRYLQKHKKSLLSRCSTAENKELKWHLAQLLARLNYTTVEFGKVWQLLTAWATDKKESRIVRVFALQTLHDLLPQSPELIYDLQHTATELKTENIPSLQARLKKLKLV